MASSDGFVFHDVTPGAGLHRTHGVFNLLMHRENKNDHTGKLRDQLFGQLDTADVRQAHIDNDRIRPHFPNCV